MPLPAFARLIALLLLGSPLVLRSAPLADGTPVRGWTLLSPNIALAEQTIDAAPAYDINHLQISHRLVHNLREIKNDTRRDTVNRLIDRAHAAGITEVTLWDHAFYALDYYPEKFRTGPGGAIDLDNPEFWEWFKADYRAMLDRVPHADGIILTFIETGARAERQHSLKLATPQEKLAAVINAVADVVIGERRLNLYARTFSYSVAEYDAILGAIARIARPEVRLMMKETPHDFFLTHPNDAYAGTIARPTLIEYDACGEFNGEGIIATTWPEYMLRRFRDLSRRPHVIGYVARTQRYNDTSIVTRPSEINLLALKRATETPDITAEQIYDEFITTRYALAPGTPAHTAVKNAFRNAYDIISSTLYTLGTNVANHTKPEYVTYASSYNRHVSGKWITPPVVHVAHDVNREFHYWRDIIDHIAPPAHKTLDTVQWRETPDIIASGWIHPEERMTEEYLRYIVAEKNYGVRLATASHDAIESNGGALRVSDYEKLRVYFAHTLITAQLHRACASAYFGFRVWCRGDEHRTPYVTETVQNGLDELRQLSQLIRDYPVKPPVGQWNWSTDHELADRYFDWIVTEGWPAETNGVPNPNAGMKFPYKQ